MCIAQLEKKLDTSYVGLELMFEARNEIICKFTEKENAVSWKKLFQIKRYIHLLKCADGHY